MDNRYQVNLKNVGLPLCLITSGIFVLATGYDFLTSCSVNQTLAGFGFGYMILASALLMIRRI